MLRRSMGFFEILLINILGLLDNLFPLHALVISLQETLLPSRVTVSPYFARSLDSRVFWFLALYKPLSPHHRNVEPFVRCGCRLVASRCSIFWREAPKIVGGQRWNKRAGHLHRHGDFQNEELKFTLYKSTTYNIPRRPLPAMHYCAKRCITVSRKTPAKILRV